MVKEYYSITELLALEIPQLPRHRPWLIAKLKKENWAFRPRTGRGGGLEYAFKTMPERVRQYICSKDATNISMPIIQNQAIKMEELKPYQRAVIDARALVLKEIENLEQIYGTNKAIEKFIEMVLNNTLPENITKALAIANAKAGSKSAKISRATIYNWRTHFLKAFACGLRERKMSEYNPLSLMMVTSCMPRLVRHLSLPLSSSR